LRSLQSGVPQALTRPRRPSGSRSGRAFFFGARSTRNCAAKEVQRNDTSGELALYKISSHFAAFMWETILLLLPPSTCTARTIAIQRYDPDPTPLVYTIHHTILVLAISCKGQHGGPLPVSRRSLPVALRCRAFFFAARSTRNCAAKEGATEGPVIGYTL